MTAKPQLACVDDYAAYAKSVLDKNAFDYFASGANSQVTLSENREAFNR